MKPAVWLFILFIVASGLSAWIGNDWGRRIGKRKLTVFALRPKHSSSLLTILLSIALSLGCMGIYLLLDPAAREALLDPASRDERQLQAYQEQISELNATLQRLQNRPATRLALADPAPSRPTAKIPTAKAALKPARPAAQNPGLKPDIGPDRDSVYVQPDDDDARIASGFGDASETPASRPAVPLKRPVPHSEHRSEPSKRSPAVQKPLPPAGPEAGAATEAAEPETPPRLASAPRDARPASAAGSWQRQHSSESAQLALLDAPIFELKVYGGRNHSESGQILSGVLDLTRAYARGLGLAGPDAKLLALQAGNLAQSRQSLEQDRIWQLQVQVGKLSSPDQALPVRLVMLPAEDEADFDPHQLLEDARLNPASHGSSLQQDLQLAIRELVRDTRDELSLETPELLQLPEIQTASLPFSLVQLQRRGQTLQGQIVLAGDGANLTEN